MLYRELFENQSSVRICSEIMDLCSSILINYIQQWFSVSFAASQETWALQEAWALHETSALQETWALQTYKMLCTFHNWQEHLSDHVY